MENIKLQNVKKKKHHQTKPYPKGRNQDMKTGGVSQRIHMKTCGKFRIKRARLAIAVPSAAQKTSIPTILTNIYIYKYIDRLKSIQKHTEILSAKVNAIGKYRP